MRNSEIGPGGLRAGVHSARIQPAPTCAHGTCSRLPCCPAARAGAVPEAEACGVAECAGAGADGPAPVEPAPLDPQPANAATAATAAMQHTPALEIARCPRGARSWAVLPAIVVSSVEMGLLWPRHMTRPS